MKSQDTEALEDTDALNYHHKPPAAFSYRLAHDKIHTPECTKTRNFYAKIFKNFWGGAQSPYQTPSSVGRRHSLPHPPSLPPLAPLA